MTGRPRHGLHVVRDEAPPGPEPSPPPHGASSHPEISRRPTVRLVQQQVVLAVGGQLNADTAGRLRMFLSMFTVEGGPEELLLDLSDVHAADEPGMAPVHEADEAMRLRSGSLRLLALSAAVSHLLTDLRRTQTFPHDVTPIDRSGPDTGDTDAPPDDPNGC